jgi:hypothetical protein
MKDFKHLIAVTQGTFLHALQSIAHLMSIWSLHKDNEDNFWMTSIIVLVIIKAVFMVLMIALVCYIYFH